VSDESKPPATTPLGHWIGLVVAAVVLAIGGVAAAGGIVSSQQRTVAAGPTTVPPEVFGTPAATPSTNQASPAPAADPDGACLAAALDAVPPTGDGTMTGQVIGLASGKVLWDKAAGQPMIPASNEKVLTALALVDALGPGALSVTYQTSVVAGPGDQIVLVGGGDPFLASGAATVTLGQPATLDDLAAATAKALQDQGRSTVALGFDDTAFTGPDWNPTWDGSYSSSVTRVSALWVDGGMTPHPVTTAEGAARRSQTPAWDAAKLFAGQLQARGIAVSSVAQTGAKAPAGATPIASIASLPLGDIIEQTLLVSDNSAAEVLLRHVAIATGRPGSFADGAAAVQAWLEAHQLAAPGLQFVDGSGLSRGNALPASTLAKAIVWAVGSDGPAREVVARLPVAAATGTLVGRFQEPNAPGAWGYVHAKTGSLIGVATLTGYTVTTSGQWLAFSVLVNGGGSLYSMRLWLDQVVATMTTARC